MSILPNKNHLHMSMIGYLLRVSEYELEGYLQNYLLLEERLLDDIDPALLDIDKTWEGILYILTGHGISTIEEAKPPLKWVIFGDYIIDEDLDMGYGPAEYRTMEQVKDVSDALQEISDEKFKMMLDNADAKMRIDSDPGILWPEGDEAFQYHLEYFKLIKDFYSKAKENGEAVISFIA